MTSKRNGEYGEGMLRRRRAPAGVEAGSAAPPPVEKGAAPPAVEKGAAGVEFQRLVAGINPLLGAANVLLALIPQLRATTSHADPAGLQRHLLERVKEFEAAARAGGVARPKIVAARYLLCTFIDEVVAATPWGASGVWAEHNLLQEFHEERSGADKAFKLLERLGEDVDGNRDVLELFYVCLALGFEGRYRGAPNGRAQLDAITTRLAQTVRPSSAGQAARTLSLRWQGVVTQERRAIAVLPSWVVAAVGGVIVLGTLLFLNTRLEAQSQPAFRQIYAVPAALRADAAAPAAKVAAVRPRLVPLLRGDQADAVLDVRDEPMRSVVTLPADALFAAGSAQVDARSAELLARVAQALSGLPGKIAVIGHTDSTPTGSLQFPSNWHLSRERALAVMQVLAQRGARAERMHAEGRADAEPVTANDTSAGRARNRRIEIELTLPRPEG